MGVALGTIAALLPVVRGDELGGLNLRNPLGRLAEHPAVLPSEPNLEGLNLLRLEMHPRRVTSPLRHGRTAELTLDPNLQRTAHAVMRRYQLPEAGAVLMDVRSGEMLVYANHVEKGVPFDVNSRVEAPAASVFKLVTAAALLEQPGISARTEQCYRGGRSRILESELRDDPSRDRWCASLAMALGRSLNVVFARLARRHLTPESLTAAAGAFGFGAPIPFDVAADAPGVAIPTDPLEFARAAAGFWHTTLSPLAGASVAQSIANDGLALRPRIVRQVLAGERVVWSAGSDATPLRRAVSPSVAHELTKMMLQTVASGTAFKTFHDKRGRPLLPRVRVAGKTGSLTRHERNRAYTWFVGFAPADQPEVAVSALVVNTPVWRIKAPYLALEVLRAYFKNRSRAAGSNLP